LVQTDEERKAKKKEANKKYNSKPEIKNKRRERDSKMDAKIKRRKGRQTSENRAKAKKYREEYQSRPETKRKVREYAARPEVKAKKKLSRAIPEARAKENARQRKYQSKPETKVKYKKKYQDNKVEILGKSKVTRVNLKKEVFSEYSKRHSNSDVPCCNCCGENFHIDFLSIDHIDGRSHLAKDERHLRANPLNVWIKNNNFPDGFQILCHNCNFTKGMRGRNNKCPHEIARLEQTFDNLESQSSFEL
jgi:hypothetical protein